MDKNLNKIVITALMAAMTCVATMVITIRIPVTGGYVNIGDTIVLLSAWLIGGVYGGIAAGLGAALADFMCGYGVYTPGTFVIKFTMAVAAYLVFRLLKNLGEKAVLRYIISGIVAEAIMVLGYFIYESVILGFGFAAAGAVIQNITQGVSCLILGTVTVLSLEKAKVTKRLKRYI